MAITTYCTLPLTAAELTQHGLQVHPIAKDLFQRQAPLEVYEEVKAKGLMIDALVNDTNQGQYG
ncbi:MAG: hypothetical protein EOO62_33065 [Hymenobacter sp.]|nr:MAG: hypothetical protein EOO62_33065 [Hymenobacter sp.]